MADSGAPKRPSPHVASLKFVGLFAFRFSFDVVLENVIVGNINPVENNIWG
jgi:hypothetical protein